MKKGGNKTKVLVILGPNASGKSALAVNLARRFNGEVISADSRQVYRGLDIGSGKITKREMRCIPHHLLDVADPKRQYSAGAYTKAAQKVIRYVVQKNKLPIFCGGTGFYIDSALGSISLPEIPPNAKLRKQLGKKSAAQLFAILKKLDPRRAREIDRHNPVRLIRAIEIAKALGKVPPLKQASLYGVLKIGIKLPDTELKRRIHRRLLARMKAGMVAEAKRLHQKGLSWKRMEALGLEYRYLAHYLQGNLTKAEMLEKLEREIWRYAKRQMRWFKRDASIIWLSPKAHRSAILYIEHWLRQEF